MQREEQKSGSITRSIEGIIQTEGDSNREVAKVAVDEMVVNVEIS